MRSSAFAALLVSLAATGCAGVGATHQADHAPAPSDGRVAVAFPEPMRTHTLANMRDHLLALQEIQQALADGAYERAADVAEKRLGMTSLRSHGAHDVARFMPEGMQAIGTEMHRSASRFAVEAANAGATGNVKPSLAALARVMQQCVACHASYRMK
ncbi:MAG TPA: hypothetical protein VFX72_06380 [Usitatibacteraceae bacterium]|nr:hypothetical protein [Usitatibacteraceae bacterium]